MAVTCLHGIGVRYLNLFGGNERYSHAMRLLEVMHADCPEATQMRVCYDVACEFESTVRDYDDEWLKDVIVRIGRFHLYGRPRRTQNIDSCGLFLGQRQRERLGGRLWKRWDKLTETVAESRGILDGILGTVMRE
jgi:hypothetical protein